MIRIVLGVLWLIHFLPTRAVGAIGSGIGALFYWLIGERRRVTRINLAKCFPEKTPAERERLARAHFRAFCRALIEQSIIWWGPRERLRGLVAFEGLEHLPPRPAKVIIFAPHFVGFEATLARLGLEFPVAMMYSRQKDPVVEAQLLRGRQRFGNRMYPRQSGIKLGIELINAGTPYYYLPDLDFGPKRAVFVPFFGVQAATVTGLAYIARSTGAAVVPCVTRMLDGGGYLAKFHPAWTDFPSGDDTADARRMMAFIEERIREMPEQYFWLHKRFKTRPPGEARFY